MLSLFLFVLFLNEYIEMLSDHTHNGSYVNDDVGYICQHLFADDMADIYDTVIGQQRQIDLLQEFCAKYGMQVNVDKTKIMVFRRGGVLRYNEVWNLNGMSWSRANETLSQQTENAMNMLLAFIYRSKLGHQKYLFLFDRIITPILIYGSEIWGYEYAEQIENNPCTINY
jgi:hypothetical protein